MIRRVFSSLTNSFKSAGWTSVELEHTGKPEDAYILNSRLIGLCDGQSKWRKSGIDPGLHAWELASNLLKSHTALPEQDKYDPLHILARASSMTSAPGSSSCMVALIHPEKAEVHAGWLGDITLLILRKELNEVKLIFQNEALMHSFDNPLVLGLEGSDPTESSVKVLEVQDKDIILMFSDGVSHNLSVTSVLKTIKPFMLLHEIPDLEIVAEMITEKAQSAFLDKSIEKPYGQATGNKFEGKNNDATLVIAEVCLKNLDV